MTAWQLLGTPVAGGVLIVGDHASNHVPPDIRLGIDPALLAQHIAIDIGVAEVSGLLVSSGAADAAYLGAVSRLVVDFNRDEHAPGLVPIASDGHAVPGNALTAAEHRDRVERYYRPYHARLGSLLAEHRPAMILSLHSFTPALASHADDARPWHVGILYNDDDRLARIALPHFTALGLCVGDQRPYSGKLLNHTMNCHAEANHIPYLGIEMRQDMVLDVAGQTRMADMIGQIMDACRHHLAQKSDMRQ